MTAIILYIILRNIIFDVNMSYCLLQIPRTQENLSEITKYHIASTWSYIKKVEKYLFIVPVLAILEIMIIIKFCLW